MGIFTKAQIKFTHNGKPKMPFHMNYMIPESCKTELQSHYEISHLTRKPGHHDKKLASMHQ